MERARPLLRGAAVILVSAGVACSPVPEPQSAGARRPGGPGTPALEASVVGCWAMTWRLAGDGRPAGLAFVPDSVSLRGGAVFGTRERLVSPATHPTGRALMGAGAGPAPWETRYRVNRWWIEDDSLTVRFSDGEGDEWHVRLGVAGRDLTGRALHSQANLSEPALTAGVRAARIACDFG